MPAPDMEKWEGITQKLKGYLEVTHSSSLLRDTSTDLFGGGAGARDLIILH